MSATSVMSAYSTSIARALRSRKLSGLGASISRSSSSTCRTPSAGPLTQRVLARVSGMIRSAVAPPMPLTPVMSIRLPPKLERPEAIVPSIVPSSPVPLTEAAGMRESSSSAVSVASARSRMNLTHWFRGGIACPRREISSSRSFSFSWFSE